MSYWYLGSPYSKYPDGLCAAHLEVCREAVRFIMAGVPVYSPIAHTHPLAMIGQVDPLDHTIWLAADLPLMEAACGLIVLKLEGWEESYGLKYEIEHFERADKAVIYMDRGEDITDVMLRLGIRPL